MGPEQRRGNVPSTFSKQATIPELERSETGASCAALTWDELRYLHWSAPRTAVDADDVLLFSSVGSVYSHLVGVVEEAKAVRKDYGITIRTVIVDNSGCSFRHLADEQQPGTVGVKGVHINYGDFTSTINCEKWLDQINDWRAHPKYNVVVHVPSTPLLFGQTNNFFYRHTRSMGKDTYMWMHSDVDVAPEALAKVAATAQAFDGQEFCVIFTHYDALAVFSARSQARYLGDWDQYLWYYGDVEYYHRCGAQGLARGELPHLQLTHHTSQTLKKQEEGAAAEKVNPRRPDHFQSRKEKLTNQWGDKSPDYDEAFKLVGLYYQDNKLDLLRDVVPPPHFLSINDINAVLRKTPIPKDKKCQVEKMYVKRFDLEVTSLPNTTTSKAKSTLRYRDPPLIQGRPRRCFQKLFRSESASEAYLKLLPWKATR